MLRAILDNPCDIQLRLVYSDWLEDQDQTKLANVIRNSINGKLISVEEIKEVYPLFAEFDIVHDEDLYDVTNHIVLFRNGFIDKIKSNFEWFVENKTKINQPLSHYDLYGKWAFQHDHNDYGWYFQENKLIRETIHEAVDEDVFSYLIGDNLTSYDLGKHYSCYSLSREVMSRALINAAIYPRQSN